ncbi:MAG: NUDIX hydrolase [Nocardioidaceae bacterium]
MITADDGTPGSTDGEADAAAAVADRPEAWPVHQVERIWQGAAPFSVRRDIISAPGRPDERFGRLVLEHPGAVVVLAVDEQDRALVLQQYRHPALLRFIELPAGLLDEPDEDPLEAARRELREEGLVLAEQWTHLFTTYSSPGLSSERIAYYLARGVSAAPDRGGFVLEHEEADMTLSWVPVDDLVAGVRDGRVTDGPTAQAVLGYRMFGDTLPEGRPGEPSPTG